MPAIPRARSQVASARFRCYVGARAVSVTGTVMGHTAIYWLTLHLAHGQAWVLSALVAAQHLPVLLLGRRAGDLVTRHRPASVLTVSGGAKAAGALAIGIPLLAGWTALWYLCLLSLAVGCVSAAGGTAHQMLVLDLAGEEELRRGSSLSRTVTGLFGLAGPALAGLIIRAAGEGPVFLADAASFLLLAAVLIALRGRAGHSGRAATGQAGHGPEPATGGGAARRLRWALDLPRAARPAILMAALVGGLGLQFEVTSPLMATRAFHLGPAGYGLFGSLMAAGGIAGSYWSSRRPAPGRREFLTWAGAFGTVETLAAVMPAVWCYDLAMVALGAAAALFTTSATVFVQQTAPPQQRGHAVSAYSAAFAGFVPAGAFAGAAVAPPPAGTRWTLAGPGFLVVACAAAALTVTGPRPVPRTYGIRPRGRGTGAGAAEATAPLPDGAASAPPDAP